MTREEIIQAIEDLTAEIRTLSYSSSSTVSEQSLLYIQWCQ